ncbi:protein kinase domain-containing protein [Nocardiopsis changdeensis]|uniref:Protein kinase n=1 Tax=Nocardiopsis changdeensis TaxID=2831969 RepID=A0ABX8BRU3_9ACTN|nr:MULTISPECIES: serine/threonine-protein kinase [Nocardiopsis]QUX23827.1 protein kinase [Nocardiopsis changdeensis]QYX39772.1 protein kinase [Nocardiopsis sp. MT53]
MPGPEPLQPSDPSAFGDYSVTGRLGKGGQGIVYLAEDPQGEEYAVKVLNDQWSRDSDLRKRFEKEVRAAQKVASFCTAAIIDAQLDSDPPYVVSEFVPGKDLQETVAKGAPLRGSALQRLAVSTATALVAIHKAGIVHRDFKPGNVLLGPDGPRVIDFGIARVDDGTATMTNSIVGTPSYMAPEQIEGRGITDKCDVFAWGCVIAFASSGRAPFGSDTVPAVVHRVISAPPDIDGVDDALRPIVAACLNKDPAQRPTAQKLLMRLLGHEDADEAPSTEDALKQGEQIAQTGLIPQGQMPVRPQTGPQGGFGHGHPGTSNPRPGMGLPGHPGTSNPQHGMGVPGHPGYPHPGTSNPRPGMGLPGHPGTSNPQHGMGVPGHPGASGPRPVGPYPQGPQPQFGNPLVTGNPNQTYGGPAQQPPAEESILQQSWVIPAVLMTILILVLLLVLIVVS